MERLGLSVCLLLLAYAAGFSLIAPAQRVAHRTSRGSQLHMGGAAGVSSTRDGKKTTVASVKEDLAKSTMIFSIPAKSLTCNQVTNMRKELPEGTKARVVKNTLLRVAARETSEWELVCEEMTKGDNMWFFVGENMSESLTVVKKFIKTAQKDKTHSLLHGVMEGRALTPNDLEALSNLPTKQELYRRIAVGIKAVPTKIARGINLVPTKIARGVKLALLPEDDDAAPAEEA